MKTFGQGGNVYPSIHWKGCANDLIMSNWENIGKQENIEGKLGGVGNVKD